MTTAPKLIRLGAWTPDAPTLSSPGLLVAKNAIPTSTDTGFHPLASLAPGIPAHTVSEGDPPADVPQPILGHVWIADSDRDIHNFAGTAGALLKLGDDLAWDDISADGGYSGVTSWEFARFGDRVIAVAPEVAPQYIDMPSGAAFDDLPGNPPSARCVAVVRDFVFLGDLYGEDNFPYRVQWSGFFNSEIWTTGDIPNQSDFNDFWGEGGRIQRIVGGEYALIFQEHAIRIAEYVGPPTIFKFDVIAEAKGTPSRGSVVRAGDAVFFYSWDGFSAIRGRQITNIGAGAVNDWFRARVATDELQLKMTAAIDRRRRLVIWSYPTAGSSTNNEMLIYNWASNRWAYADVGAQTLSEWAAPGYTLEALDDLVGNNIDEHTVSLDSDAYKGGNVAMIAFDSDGAGRLFEGTPGVAEFVTGEATGEGGARVFVAGIRPLVDDPGAASDVRAAAYGRGSLAAPPDLSGWTPMDVRGEVPLRLDTRYMRPALRVQGRFYMAQGLEVLLRQSGKR